MFLFSFFRNRLSKHSCFSELEQTCPIPMWEKMAGDKWWTTASCWPPVISPQRNNLHWEDQIDVESQGPAKTHLQWWDENIADRYYVAQVKWCDIVILWYWSCSMKLHCLVIIFLSDQDNDAVPLLEVSSCCFYGPDLQDEGIWFYLKINLCVLHFL